MLAFGYGVLFSKRRRAGVTMNLLNRVSARFGKEILWTRFRSAIVRLPNGKNLYVQFRGNKFADYLELLCVDVDLLRQIRKSFRADFPSVVQEEKGFLE